MHPEGLRVIILVVVDVESVEYTVCVVDMEEELIVNRALESASEK